MTLDDQSPNPRPKVFTLPPEQPFADALAAGLKARFSGSRDRLADVLLLLPNRRACRSLREAFLRGSGGQPLLLPRLLPLGDLDEEELLLTDPLGLSAEAETSLPPAMPPLVRQFRLAQLVSAWRRSLGRAEDRQSRGGAQDLLLAAELGRLLDQVETEGLDFSRLADLVPEEHAGHWQTTLRFLEIITHHWPEIEREAGAIGAAARRRRLMEWQADAWARNPPGSPVIAAGSTGSIPATARLLSLIARLREGEVILPGLDRHSDAATWEAIAEDPSHPQFGMARLLEGMGVERRDVQDWRLIDPSAPDSRSRLINLSLAPAKLTDRWIDLEKRFGPELVRESFRDVERVDCPGLREEAAVVALALREVLEKPGRTGALVTPDRTLARRVAAELRRWDIEIDDSAGRPLGDTAVGAYLRLVARLLAEGPSPLLLLAVLKHPKAAGGMAAGHFRRKLRVFERLVLRGPLPAASLTQLRGLLADSLAEAKERDRRADVADLEALRPWFEGLSELLEPVARRRAREAPLQALLGDHVRLAEALADDGSEKGAERLWTGEDGEAAASFLRQFLEATEVSGKTPVRDYAEVFDSLIGGQVVRPRYGLHPRLFIWGPMEARLQRADRVILGGLNEGTWPVEADPGPWMSRPMRAAFGLPSAERSIGLSAHDFAQALSAREVILTRAERIDGTPTVPSRWLLRLETLLGALGAPPDLLNATASRWLGWAEALDRPAAVVPAKRPAPCPPPERRPVRASITEIERWQRDPYAFYAASILKLRRLDDLDAEPGAAERGTLIHALLEDFTRAFPAELPADLRGELHRRMDDLLDKLQRRPALAAYWEPRLGRILDWVVAQERRRRASLRRVHAESRGRLNLPEAQDFLLHGKADRIEELRDGGLVLLDYKTGAPPSRKDVLDGRAPQLVLEAIVAEAGGFEALGESAVSELVYWQLSGGAKKGVETVIPVEADFVAATRERLTAFLLAYADPRTPFLARPRPGHSLRFNDYAHLAREKEWAADGGEG